MVNGRNGFTYVANIFVLSLSTILFVLITNSATCFSVLCITCLVLGGFATLWYVINIKETYLSKMALILEAKYRENLTENEADNLKQHLSATEIADPNNNLTQIEITKAMIEETAPTFGSSKNVDGTEIVYNGIDVEDVDENVIRARQKAAVNLSQS